MMHSYSKRIIAIILLFSHSLMSCLNTPAGTNKEGLARIAQKANKKHLAKQGTDEQESHSHQAHTLTCTTAAGQRIAFTYAQGSWQAQLLQDNVERADKLSTYIPVVFEPGYQLTDISTADSHQQKKLVHLIPTTTTLDKVAYIYIGREPTTFNYKAKQRSYPTNVQQADTNTDKQLKPTPHQSLKQNLLKETASIATTHLPEQLSNKQPLLQPEEETETRSRKPISTVRQQSTIKATQQAAKEQRAQANQTEEKIELFEKGPTEQTTEPAFSQELSLLYPAERAIDLEQPPIFIAKGGHRVQFTDDVCQEVIVHENVPLPLSRPPLKLRVITEEPNLHLQDLLAHSEAWHKNYIQVIFPEYSPDGKGYVYIGSLGVRGGGNTANKEGDYVTCNECGNSARVVRTVKADQFLWINFIDSYYQCEYCAQRRRAREQRERDERLRREQERIREEQERREQEHRRIEEERRKREEQDRLERLRREQIMREEALRREEEERKQRRWEEEARKTLEKLERELEEGTRKVENLEKEHEQQRKKTAQVDQNLTELRKTNLKSIDLSKKLAQTCERNQHSEEELVAKQQYKKELYERIKKTHVGTENLSKKDTQEGVKKFAERRNQSQSQAKGADEASRKRDQQLEELAQKLRALKKKLEPSNEELKNRADINFGPRRSHAHSNVDRNNKSLFQEYEATLKQYKATLERYEAALLGRSRNIEKDIKNREEIEQTIQAMRRVIEKEQSLLQESLTDSEGLQKDLQEEIKKESARYATLLKLEKGLEELQQATTNTSKLEGQLAQTKAKNEQAKKLVKEVEKVYQENKDIEEELAAAYHNNEELINNIQETYDLQEDIGNHFKEAQQNLLKATAIREEAVRVQSSIKGAIKERAEQIELLKANIKQIQEAEAKKRATLLTEQKEDKSDDTTAKSEEIKHGIQALEKQLEQEQQILEEQYIQLKSIQDNLKEQLQQEKDRGEALVELERKLKRNKEVGDEIEAIIKEAWEKSLASSIASDEQLEAYINRLRKEEKLLKERGMSEQALEELTRHVALAEKKLKEAQIEKTKQEQEAHRKEAEDLRNAYAARRDQLEKELQDLEGKEAAEQAEYERKMAEWEANNRKKSKEEAQRLEQLRREAEEARRAVEEGKRELERQAAEAARQKENNKPWWKKAWDKTKAAASAVWNSTKEAINTVVKGVKWVGNRIVDGCKAVGKGISWLGEKTWEGTKWLGGKIWEGLKIAGKWIWDHKKEILIFLGLVVLSALVVGGIALGISAILSAAGIGSLTSGGAAILSWLTGTTVGKFVLGTLVSLSGGSLILNGERITNYLRGRGWVTNKEHDEKEKRQSSTQQQSSQKDGSHNRSEYFIPENKEDLRRPNPFPTNSEAEETDLKEEARKQQEAREKEEAERKAQQEAWSREEARKQQEAQQREREEAQREAWRRKEARRQQEAREKKKAEREAQQEAHEKEEARKKAEEEEESARKKREDVFKADREKEKEKEKPSDFGNESTNNSFQNFFKKFTDSFKQPGPEQQKENSKVAQIEAYAKQAQNIVAEYQRTGSTPELQDHAQELVNNIETLIQQEEIAQKMLSDLDQGYDNSPELQEHLEQRLKEIAENISKLKEARDKLTEQPDLLPEEDLESEDNSQEEAAYEDLTKHFRNPMDAAELADNGQQAVQDLLQQLATESKEALQEQAIELRDALGSLMKNMQSQHAHTQYVYEDDPSDYMIQISAKGKQDLKSLENSMKRTEASLGQLCKAFDLGKPDLTPEPPISKEALKKAFNMVLDQTVPGSDLIKILLGTVDKPQNLEECLKLAVSTVLDFIPGGKAYKAFKGAAAKLGIKKIESQLLKEAKKAAKRVGKGITKNFDRIPDILLKKRGIDAHKLKMEWLGDKANISRFDLYKDKSTGEILILPKGGQGIPIHTGEFIK